MNRVYLYGMITPSTVYVLANGFRFPEPDNYAEIGLAYPSVGGEAVNSAIMLSKLGIRTKLDGNWINSGYYAGIMKLLKPFGIDMSRLKVKEKSGTLEFVVTDGDSRTVFGNYAAFHNGEKQWNEPREEDIRSADYISIDPYFRQESIDAGQLSVKNDKPYVTIDCRHDDSLARNAESVIISGELRDRAYRGCDMKEIFGLYLAGCRGLVIFTFGSDDLWYSRPGKPLKKFKPYRIDPVDTAGAGDTFRSGIIYGLMNNWDDEKTIDFASAVSACVCLSIPHSLNAPRLDGVLKFMEENRRG